MVGPPVWVTVCTTGKDCEQVVPDQLVPLNVRVPEQVRLTAPAGVSPPSCDAVRFAGV